MLTQHAELRMAERNINETDVFNVLNNGKWNDDYKGRDNIKEVVFGKIKVIVDICSRDIITVYCID